MRTIARRSVTAHAGDRHPQVGEAGFQRFLQLSALGVEKLVPGLVRGEGNTRDDLARPGPQEPGRIDLGVFVAEPALLDIVKIDGCFVSSEVGGDVEPLVVEGEKQRVEGFLEIRGRHHSEGVFFGLAIEQAGAHTVGGDGHPQPAVVVGQPPETLPGFSATSTIAPVLTLMR